MKKDNERTVRNMVRKFAQFMKEPGMAGPNFNWETFSIEMFVRDGLYLEGVLYPHGTFSELGKVAREEWEKCWKE